MDALKINGDLHEAPDILFCHGMTVVGGGTGEPPDYEPPECTKEEGRLKRNLRPDLAVGADFDFVHDLGCVRYIEHRLEDDPADGP